MIACEIPYAQLAATPTEDLHATATADAAINEVSELIKDWQTVLKERFKSNKNYLWYTGDSEDELAKVIVEVKDGAYIWDLTAYDGFYTGAESRVRPVSSFHISADVHLKRGKMAEYGVLFRVNEDSFYLFQIDDDKYYNVSIYLDGEWTTLQGWTKSFAIKPYEINRLSVLSQRSQFYFFINDQFVGQVEDDSIIGGRIGCYASLDEGDKAVIEFDNITVLAP